MALILSACSSGTGGGAGGGAAAGGGAGGGSTGGSGGGSGGTVVKAATSCPHVVLQSTVPVTYQGDTSAGLPNWVTSTRLEWTDAPDDSLIFVAPTTGKFFFSLSSSNSNLGVSIKNADGTLHAAQGCPASGATLSNDGFFESPAPTDGGVGYPSSLDAGTSVLIWISAPYWAAQKTGAYTLRITAQ